MANESTIRLTARDETAAAYSSATRRMDGYGASVRGAGANQQQLAQKTIAQVSASNALTAALNGNTAAFGQAAMSATKYSAGMQGVAIAIAKVAIIAAITKKVMTELGLVTRVKALFTGQDVSEVTGRAEAIEKRTRDVAAAQDRARQASAAAAAARQARIERETGDAPVTRATRTAVAQYEREFEQIAEGIAAAEQRVSEARGKRQQAGISAGWVASESDLKAIREAQAELERAEADAAAAHARSIDQRTAATDKYQAALAEAAKQAQKLNESMSGQQIDDNIQSIEADIANKTGYIDRRDAALAKASSRERLRSMGMDPEPTGSLAQQQRQARRRPQTLRDLVVNAFGGGEADAQALRERQQAAAGLDQLGALFQARSDPDARAQASAIERERNRTENRLEKARAADARGGPMATWQKEILADSRAIEEQIRDQRERDQLQAAVEAEKERKAAEARERLAREFAALAADLKLLLVAAGRG